MLRRRRMLLQRQPSDDEFETPAFKEIDGGPDSDSSNSDQEIPGDVNSESDETSNDDELEVTDKHGDEDEGDSDEAPEDVGFSESRKTALTQMRDVMNKMKEEKLQLKTKRKLKDEKFKEQKRVKLEALNRLSEDVINSLPEELSEPKKEDMTSKKNKKKEKKKKDSKEGDGQIAEMKKQILSLEETEDYVPLESGFLDSESGIKAVSLKDMKKRMAVTQSAANFRNSRLYGDPRQRESTKAYLAKMKKKRIMHKGR